MQKNFLAVLVLAISSATTAQAAVTALTEHFNYANQAALNAAWTSINGQGGYLVLGTESSIDPNQPYAQLQNGLISRSLSTTVTTDWTVSFRLTNPDRQRGTWLGLFDETGKYGYAFFWDSGNDNPGPGNGTVSIRKFDLTVSLNDWQINGTQLGSPVNSGHVITNSTMANITLSWQQATGTLTITVDGVTKVTLTDTSFNSFSKIYIKGNGRQYYDDIIVTAADPVPEGASLSVLGMSALALLHRSRKN